MLAIVIFLIVIILAHSDQDTLNHNRQIHESSATTKFESQHEIEVKSKDLPIHAITTYEATKSFVYPKAGGIQPKIP